MSGNKDKRSIGEKIKEARLKKYLTQKKLAEIIGVEQESISGYENNRRNPRETTKKLLRAALDIEI